jgi:hypothetical protein
MSDSWTKLHEQWWNGIVDGYPMQVDIWRDSEDLIFRSYAKSWRMLVEAIAAAQLAAQQSADPAALIRSWNDAQREAWRNWLAVASGFQPDGWPHQWQNAGSQMMSALHDAAISLVAAEAEWVREWNAGG